MTSNELEIFKQSILDEVQVMMQTTGQVTQYIGARYVPLFAEPLNWSNTKEYEPLTIVLYQGNSYTSRQFVPKGIDISDTAFWANTGNYNAQIEQYRKEVEQHRKEVAALGKDVASLKSEMLDTFATYADAASYDGTADIIVNGNLFSKGGGTVNNLDVIATKSGAYKLRDKFLNVDASNVAAINGDTAIFNRVKIVSSVRIPISNAVILEDGVNLDSLDFELSGSNVFIYPGRNSRIANCRFYGSGTDSNAVRVIKNGVTITECYFEYEGTSTVTFIGAKDCVFSGNTIKNYTGFAVQTYKATNIIISDNVIEGRVFESSQAISANVFTMRADFEPSRAGVRVDGKYMGGSVDISGPLVSYNSSSNGLAIGRAYLGLEAININSESKFISVTDNVISNCGDSGVVIGSDYHNGQIDPGATMLAEHPSNITIANNNINNCLASGIAVNNASTGVSIVGNTIYNTGFFATDVYRSGIYILNTYEIVCTGNIISNTNINGKPASYIDYGVALLSQLKRSAPLSDLLAIATVSGNSINASLQSIRLFADTIQNTGVRRGIFTDAKRIEIPYYASSNGIFKSDGEYKVEKSGAQENTYSDGLITIASDYADVTNTRKLGLNDSVVTYCLTVETEGDVMLISNSNCTTTVTLKPGTYQIPAACSGQVLRLYQGIKVKNLKFIFNELE